MWRGCTRCSRGCGNGEPLWSSNSLAASSPRQALIIVSELTDALKRVVREKGLSILIVEQHAPGRDLRARSGALTQACRVVIFDRDSVVYAGMSASSRADAPILEHHRGVTGAKVA